MAKLEIIIPELHKCNIQFSKVIVLTKKEEQTFSKIDPFKSPKLLFVERSDILEGKSKDCISLLKKADILPPMEQWPLFQLLFKKQKLFKDAFEKQLKKTQKKHKNYQKN